VERGIGSIESVCGRSYVFPQPLFTVTIEKAPAAQRIENLSHLDDKKLRDLTLSLKRYSIIITQSCVFVKLSRPERYGAELWNVDFYPKCDMICPESEGGSTNEQISTR
jgi:hypothetical protein